MQTHDVVSPPEAEAIAMRNHSDGDPRILVIDDDAYIRNSLCELLRREGYRVLDAEDGEAGYQLFSSQQIDIIITDEDMPRMRGLDFLRKLRAMNVTVPAILISGNVPWNDPELEALVTPGFALEKPFSFAQLLKNVRLLLLGQQVGTLNGGGWR